MKRFTLFNSMLLIVFLAILNFTSFAQSPLSAVEQEIYSTGFESSEGFTAGTVYNNTDILYSGATGKEWGTYYGTPSTTSPLTGSQSMQMRWYPAAITNLGYTFTNFNLPKVTKVTFKANKTNNLKVLVTYSTDNGTTWTGGVTFDITSSTALNTYNISSTGEFNNVRIKFQIELPSTNPTSTSRLYIDDVVVYGMVDASAPTITVSSPTTGADWEQGTSENITWTSANITDNVKIEYTHNASEATPTWTELAASVPVADGSWTWAIPINQPISTDSKIRITNISATATGESGTFNITAPTPILTSIAALRASATENEYILSSEAIISFLQSFRKQKYIQDATAGILIDDNSGIITTTYAIGDGITGIRGTLNEYGGMMQFTPVENTGAASSTGNVLTPVIVTIPTLTSNFEDYESELVKLENVTFTNPNGNFVNGQVYEIKDASNNTYNFRTTFYDVDYIGTPIPTTPLSMVAIPNSITAGNYITSRSLEDFIITASSINITSPNGGEILQQGTTHDITWISNNITGNVKIELIGTNASIIAASVENNGTFTWNIPADQAIANDYKIKISDVNTGTIIDESNDVFSIIAPIPVPKIFISEYIESSNNKVIEIYNGTGEEINLNLLTVRLYANGNTTPSNNTFSPTSSDKIAPNKTYVLHNSGANILIENYGDIVATLTNFNGDDAIEVLYDGITCDVFGKIGEDPGTGWAVAGIAKATEDHTLLRKLNITQGNIEGGASFGTTADNSEWVVKDIDYFENLGTFGAALTSEATGNWSDLSWDMYFEEQQNTNFIIKKDGTINITAPTNIKSLYSKSALTVNIPSTSNFVISDYIRGNATEDNFYFDIKSDANGTGMLIVKDFAKGKLERYITGNIDLSALCHHGVSLPFIDNEQPVSGLFMGSYLYEFDEASNTWVSLGSSTTTELFESMGYLIYYPGASKTYEFDGFLNTKDYQLTLSKNGEGFNFIPNRFTSNIDFSKIGTINSDITNGFWIWSAGNYLAYSNVTATGTASKIIPVGQAFFMQTSSEQTIDFTHQMKTTEAQTFYKANQSSNQFNLKAVAENTLADEIIVLFGEQWSDGTDNGDMVKLQGSAEAPQLSSINTDDTKLTINTQSNFADTKTIPLDFSHQTNDVIKFTADLSALSTDIDVYLRDVFVNTIIDLRENPFYVFNNIVNNPNRFELIFQQKHSNTDLTTDNNRIYKNGDYIVLDIPSMNNSFVEVGLYDVKGSLLQINKTKLQTGYQIEAPKVAGVYIVRIINENQNITKKFVIQ